MALKPRLSPRLLTFSVRQRVTNPALKTRYCRALATSPNPEADIQKARDRAAVGVCSLASNLRITR